MIISGEPLVRNTFALSLFGYQSSTELLKYQQNLENKVNCNVTKTNSKYLPCMLLSNNMAVPCGF